MVRIARNLQFLEKPSNTISNPPGTFGSTLTSSTQIAAWASFQRDAWQILSPLTIIGLHTDHMEVYKSVGINPIRSSPSHFITLKQRVWLKGQHRLCCPLWQEIVPWWAKFLITQDVTLQWEPYPLNPQCDGISRPMGHLPFELEEWKPSFPGCSSPTQTHTKYLKTTRLAQPPIDVIGGWLRMGGWNLGVEGRPRAAGGLCVLTAFLHSSFLCGWLLRFLKTRVSLLSVGNAADFYVKEGKYDKERVLESNRFVSNSSYNILSSKVLGKLHRYFLVSLSQYEGLGW